MSWTCSLWGRSWPAVSSSPPCRVTTAQILWRERLHHLFCTTRVNVYAKRTFLFLHNIGMKHFKNLKKSYLTNGPAVRVHRNKEKKPKHHLTLQQIRDIIQYILNYTGLYVDIHAQRRLMLLSYLGEFLDTRTQISSSSPAAQLNTECGRCIRKLQVSSPCVLLATPPSQDCGGNYFLVLLS